MRAHEPPLVQALDGRLTVTLARTADDQQAAARLLDQAEHRAGGPLVDEAERERLDQITHLLDHPVTHDHPHDAHEHWHLLLAWLEGQPDPVGYAGLVLPPGRAATGDLVPGVGAEAGTGAALLQAVKDLADEHNAPGTTMWLRHATEHQVQAAASVGWVAARTLLVLEAHLTAGEAAAEPRPRGAAPDGIKLTPHHPDRDGEVARLLSRAYADVGGDTWDLEEMARRRAMPWFRPEDLLLAHRGDDLVGIHWMKRRDDRTGEVYNLAIDPDAQGMGLGSMLLDAGMAHLTSIGAERIILWVDAANTAGRALYGSRGFVPLWQDVALSPAG